MGPQWVKIDIEEFKFVLQITRNGTYMSFFLSTELPFQDLTTLAIEWVLVNYFVFVASNQNLTIL